MSKITGDLESPIGWEHSTLKFLHFMKKDIGRLHSDNSNRISRVVGREISTEVITFNNVRWLWKISSDFFREIQKFFAKSWNSIPTDLLKFVIMELNAWRFNLVCILIFLEFASDPKTKNGKVRYTLRF